MVNIFKKLIAPYARRIYLMIGRGVVKLVDDTKQMQEMQVTLLEGEVRSDVERFQNYGFTSVPFGEAEHIMVSVGGDRNHGIIIVVDDRRYRAKGLQEGEVAQYDDQGMMFHFKRDKIMHAYGCDEFKVESATKASITSPEITETATIKATVTAPTYEVTAALKAQINSGAINLGGERSGLRALMDERSIGLINSHGHAGTGSASAGAPTVAITQAQATDPAQLTPWLNGHIHPITLNISIGASTVTMTAANSATSVVKGS